MPDQPHSGLMGSPAALPVVAGKAGGHDILPRCLTTLHLWYHMVERQLFSGMPAAAVLTGVLVPLVDIGTGKPDFTACSFDLDQFEEAEDGWQPEGDGDTPHLAVVEVNDLHLALRKEGDRPLPGYDLERFER